MFEERRKKMGFDTDGVFDDHACMMHGCTFHSTSRRSMGNHLAKSHDGMTIKDYVLKFFLNEEEPKCGCGCGQIVKWHRTMYRFNDYVNGHNKTGFDISEHHHTEEQIEKRNASIKRTYSGKSGDDIKKKISEKVVHVLSSKEWKDEQSRRQKEIWSNKEYKDKMSSIRKRVWIEQGDELRKKIFTPEFGKKVSISNMKRSLNRKSKQEDEFVAMIREKIDGDVVQSKWVTFNDGLRKCVDAYLPKYDMYVEFDGAYWHGFDRTGPFDLKVIQNISRDIHKNLMFEKNGLSLIRILSTIDISTIESIDDLMSNAYHIVIEGKTFVDGTKHLADDEPIVSREYLLRANGWEGRPGDPGRDWTEKELLPAIIDLVIAHVEHWGWFYPPCRSGGISKALRDVAGASFDPHEDVISSKSSAGNMYLKSIFQSFWDVDDGPSELTMDRGVLENVLRYRMGLNNSRPYEYVMPGVGKIRSHEMFDVSLAEIRTGFVVCKHCVSFFKPAAAAHVYGKLLGDVIDPIVWDPSGGFGARMLGFFSQYPSGTYVCCEPADKIARDLELLANEIVSVMPDANIIIDRRPSEEFDWNDRPFDLVFTSPPYFDKEKYYDEDTQCWKRYPNEFGWEIGYLVPTIVNSYLFVRDGGHVVFNVDHERRSSVISAMEGSGLKIVKELSLDCGADHFARKNGRSSSRNEPVIVSVK